MFQGTCAPLRIGINALYLIPGEVGGTEIYLRSLLEALAAIDFRNEYFIYANAETDADLTPRSPRFQLVRTDVQARFRPGRILYEQTVLPWLLRRDGISVLLNPGFTGPVSFASRSATVFHDLQHKRHPEFFRWFELPFWNLLLWAAAGLSRSLIAVSQATAADLARFYPWSRDKTVVVPHGVDEEFFRIAERRLSVRTTEPYLLTVSTLHPHKNLHRLLDAFNQFHSSHPEFRLIVAGLKGFAAQALEEKRRNAGLEACVHFTGWIPRAELYQLFEHADAYIAPSEFEGFGMPVIEALAAGIPTACSAIQPFDELTGDACARFRPDSIAEMMQAMSMISSDADFRDCAKVAGPARAHQFDWRRSAALTLEALESVSCQRSPRDPGKESE